MSEVTWILAAIERGDMRAEDELFPFVVYCVSGTIWAVSRNKSK
jgi:hypothetical protein